MIDCLEQGADPKTSLIFSLINFSYEVEGLVKRDREVLHFLYQLKNNPWEDFIDSAVLPDFECGSYINLYLYLYLYL